MKRKEFLERINTRLAARNFQSVSDRQLGDWLDESLIDAPKPIGLGRGTKRDWGWRQFRQILEIAKAKSRGPSRTSLVRIYCWINGRDFPFDVIHEDVTREFKRIWNDQYSKTKGLSYDPRNRDLPKAGQIKSTGNAVGKLDSRLVPPNVEANNEEKLGFDAIMRFGIEKQKSVLDYANKIGPKAVQLKEEDLKFLNKTVSGLLGDPQEILITGISAVESSTFEDFEFARKLIKCTRRKNSISRRGLELAIKMNENLKNEFSEVLKQLRTAELASHQTSWIVLLFVSNLNALQTDHSGAKEYLLKSQAEIKLGNQFLMQAVTTTKYHQQL